MCSRSVRSPDPPQDQFAGAGQVEFSPIVTQLQCVGSYV